MTDLAMRAFALAATLLLFAGQAQERSAWAAEAQPQTDDARALDRSYRRLLPLEGGSNFRDMGGYRTHDGRVVKRGVLFRSGAPTSLTEADFAYLSQFQFKVAMDLRSREERDLFPNRWAEQHASVAYKFHDYSIRELMGDAEESSARPDMNEPYRTLPQLLAPQLKTYFETLLGDQTPVVVHCSAGQDRTGFTAALLLSLLGVPRDVVIEDYLLSTDFRRPENEYGDVDLQAASAHNEFAKMLLSYGQQGVTRRPSPLVTEDGTPFIVFALDQLQRDFGSPEGYVTEALGISHADIERLRSLYLID